MKYRAQCEQKGYPTIPVYDDDHDVSRLIEED